ncbi:transposase [Shewanella atlantica]|uniref:transposase n=1 Tax=Shewanella atlantica TaxID=271099 RepID=UPI003CCC6382
MKQVCQEYGISEVTYYNWKGKFGGMEELNIRYLCDLKILRGCLQTSVWNIKSPKIMLENIS